MGSHYWTIIAFVSVIFALSSNSFVLAYDPSPLQDFCVADPKATVLVNGRACKDPKLVTADDFSTSGLNASQFPAAFPGSWYSAASVNTIPGLNTLGLTMVRNDYLPGTVIPPHIHSRATELALVLKGTFNLGFAAVDPKDPTKNVVFSKTCNAGDVFVVPQGLVHFGESLGVENGTTITVFNSQSPGFNFVADQLFGKETASFISEDLLAKSFRVDNKVIEEIRSKF
ncbi:hypothetical protein DM860_001692 [Cuscuta australis]|uniref:Germin-like protein n=1 Tax=Cuscuta australis TaxID=267555 RepID=A0A328E9C2_9ASTE|nr:hypothetical protein DM860_001692 [Cuscuta australis]